MDKMISRTRAKLDVTVTRVDQPSDDVIQLRMRLASGKVFKYKPGQYLYLQVPEIDKREWSRAASVVRRASRGGGIPREVATHAP